MNGSERHKALMRNFEIYFGWIDEVFGSHANVCRTQDVRPGEIAAHFLSDPGRRERFNANDLPRICLVVTDFWNRVGREWNAECRTLPGLRASFGGDIGPQVLDGVFSAASLYFETIFVPDPLLRIVRMPGATLRNKDYYTVKYGIMQALLREVYLAPVYPPIAILFAEEEMFKDEPSFDYLSAAGEACIVEIINETYHAGLETFQDVVGFMGSFDAIGEAIRAAADPSLFYFDGSVEQQPEPQVDAALERLDTEIAGSGLSGLSPMEKVPFLLMGRVKNALDILWQAELYGTSPLVTAPASFHWLNRIMHAMENALERTNQAAIPKGELLRTNALLGKRLKWIADLPIDTLVQLRRNGYLSDVRDLISRDIETLVSSPSASIEQVAATIDKNLCDALTKHQNEIDIISSEIRAGHVASGVTFLTAVAGSFGAVAVGVPQAWVAAAATLTAGVSLSRFIESVVSEYHQRRRINRTPAGILWQALKDTNQQR